MAVFGATNSTSTSSNITSAFGSLALGLLSAAGAVGITDLARSQGQQTYATGNPLNPIQVVPATQASAVLSQQSGTLLIIGAFGLVGILALFAFRR